MKPKPGARWYSFHGGGLSAPPITADATPGTPKAQFETGARALAGDLQRSLTTQVGTPKFMGSPLRAVCAAVTGSKSLNGDAAWVKSRVKKAAAGVLFSAHLSLVGADAAAPSTSHPKLTVRKNL